MQHLRQVWSSSKVFRIILIAAFIYASLRLIAQIWLMSEHMLPGQSETQIFPNDLQDYITGSARLANHASLYVQNGRMEFYQYPPVYAFVFMIFLWLPPILTLTLLFLLHLAAYYFLYICWNRIFEHIEIKQASEILAWTLPVWLVFSAFWSDLAFMNIYIITALFATLFIEAVINENLAWSVIWFSILFQTKPHWTFALAVPLLLGQWRFFSKLLFTGILMNAAIIGSFLLIVGPAYGWQQHIDYIYFLAGMRDAFPWRTMADGFLGYNHSITQIVVFLLGLSPNSMQLATTIKILLLIPLFVVCAFYLIHPPKRAGHEIPQVALDMAFLLYLGVFIWADMVWEVSLSIAIFAYLFTTLKTSALKNIIWIVFLPYALVDFWQLVSYGIFGDAILLPGGYVATDPTIYFPLIMVVILVFYGIFLKRLWSSLPAWKSTEVRQV